MKKLLCFIILITSLTFGYSQKREVYLDDDLNNISKESFEKNRDLSKFLYLTFSADSLKVNLKTERIVKGKISKENLISIRDFLVQSSGKKIPETNKLVINYWPGNQYCDLPNDLRTMNKLTKAYQKKIAKIENSSQFFVAADLNGIDKLGNIQWNLDS